MSAAGNLRVLHLVKTSDWALWALYQMQELVRAGIEVHVALPAGGRLIPQYEAAGVVVHAVDLDLQAASPWSLPATLSRFRALVETVQPQVIHSHFVATTLLARLALGRRHPIPRLFQVPGPLHLEHAATRGADLATAGAADWWIGSCRWTVDRYRRSGVPDERLFLSYYGLDVERFGHGSRGRLRGELGLAPDQTLIGMLAFVYPPKRYLAQTRGPKGHEDLLDALAICLRQEPGLRCVFAGGAWSGAAGYERRIRAYASKRCGDAAIFLGVRSDVPDLLAELDLLAVPSRSENVGAAVEGLLCGAPVVATNVGGLPDLVEDPLTGWLVPPRDPARLAAAMLEALRDPAEAAARAGRGRDRARQMFDARRTAHEVRDIYQRVRAQQSAARSV
jgi:glycosyltransferase involved in cell wall biosynthesis